MLGERAVGPHGRAREGRTRMSLRSLLYQIAKLMGDVNAVKKGKVGRRLGRRNAALRALARERPRGG